MDLFIIHPRNHSYIYLKSHFPNGINQADFPFFDLKNGFCILDRIRIGHFSWRNFQFGFGVTKIACALVRVFLAKESRERRSPSPREAGLFGLDADDKLERGASSSGKRPEQKR